MKRGRLVGGKVACKAKLRIAIALCLVVLFRKDEVLYHAIGSRKLGAAVMLQCGYKMRRNLR
jgi:hypothetical protein